MANRFYAFLCLALIVWFALSFLAPTTLSGEELALLDAM